MHYSPFMEIHNTVLSGLASIFTANRKQEGPIRATVVTFNTIMSDI